MRRALTAALNRRAWNSSLSTSSSGGSERAKEVASVLAASVAVAAGGLTLASREEDTLSLPNSSLQLHTTSCEFREDVIHVSNENSEEERFEQCVAYHRCFLADYRDRWQYKAEATQTTPTTSAWPLHVPIEEEVPSLEFDKTFCNRAPNKKSTYCANLKFRLASYYLRQEDPEVRKKGFKMVKRLAESGHGDAMCMYGIVLNEGKIVDSNAAQATVWWRRAVDMSRHVQSTYELAVAFYTGEGVPESEELAVYYFEKAATLGHAGAAYMLGDCLLDGVGAPRDRAEALEWLVAAGELGHRGARSRVLAVLENDTGTQYGRFTDKSRQTLVEDVEEEAKWSSLDDTKGPREVSVERRFTIGGGSGNPVVLAKRKTIVAESRTP